MTDIKFANHLADEIVDIVTVAAIRDQDGIFLVNRRPVVAMHVWCIEEVTHLAPCLSVDLSPFLMQIDPFLHV